MDLMFFDGNDSTRIVGGADDRIRVERFDGRNVHYNDIDLALGYSKLDYLAKYENNYFGPVADITASVGVEADMSLLPG